MNSEPIDLFADLIAKEAKANLADFGAIASTWHMIKNGDVTLVSKSIYSEEDENEAEDIVKLSVCWLEPEAIIQTTMIDLTDTLTSKHVEGLAIIKHLRGCNPIASMCKVHRNSRGQVLFFENVAVNQELDMGGSSFLPYEPATRNPSDSARRVVNTIFAPNEERLFKVIR
ncbi:hypothetical protein RYA05_05610 [Pseudomonas syringae pv. actinidiae]|nr:hypothetical protein [Pseudomonas syringae pv. actinidiae]